MMTNKAWKSLWLEIAEDMENPQRSDLGFCPALLVRSQRELAEIVFDMTLSITNRKIAIYQLLQGRPDPIRCFTACFIAEIGEAEFMALAESK